MTLSNDDLEKIGQSMAQAIGQAARPQRDFTAIWEGFTRILTTITAAGILWLLLSTSDLKGEIAVIKNEQSSMIKTIEKLEGMLETVANQPRFTSESFASAISPLEQSIRRNESDITGLKTAVSNLERSVMKLEKADDMQ